jgi:hypothetical protein
MEEIELDERQANFLRGWFAGRGIERRPTLTEFSEALQALVEAGYIAEPGDGEEYQPIRLQ